MGQRGLCEAEVRRRNFIDLIQQDAAWQRGRTVTDGPTGSFPMCLTCLNEVEAVEITDQNHNSIEVLAKCHGAEDFFRIEFPFRINVGNDPIAEERQATHIRQAMRAACLFDPAIPEK